MKNTLMKCYDMFGFSMGFVGSDEISLYLKPKTTEEIEKNDSLLFNGRIQKMVSLLAGKVSVVFYNEIKSLLDLPDDIFPHFDCRVFQFSTFDEVKKNFSERILFTMKNSRMMLCQHYYTQKELKNISSLDAVEKLKIEKGIDYNEIVHSDNRVGNVLTLKSIECTKDILIKGVSSTVTFSRKIPVLQNLSPSEMLEIEI